MPRRHRRFNIAPNKAQLPLPSGGRITGRWAKCVEAKWEWRTEIEGNPGSAWVAGMPAGLGLKILRSRVQRFQGVAALVSQFGLFQEEGLDFFRRTVRTGGLLHEIDEATFDELVAESQNEVVELLEWLGNFFRAGDCFTQKAAEVGIVHFGDQTADMRGFSGIAGQVEGGNEDLAHGFILDPFRI